MTELTKHTPGAIRAAEAITQAIYEDTHRTISTRDGRKTTREIADLIDQETSALKLLEALKAIHAHLVNGDNAVATMTELTRAAIEKVQS